MQQVTAERGRLKIDMKAFDIGEDVCVILSGGDRPHIGCVTLSIPRASLAQPDDGSATTSVLNLTGHKDEEAARFVSHTLSAKLQKNVVVTGGIHVDNITKEEINIVMELLVQLTNQLLENRGQVRSLLEKLV